MRAASRGLRGAWRVVRCVVCAGVACDVCAGVACRRAGVTYRVRGFVAPRARDVRCVRCAVRGVGYIQRALRSMGHATYMYRAYDAESGSRCAAGLRPLKNGRSTVLTIIRA